MFFLDLSKSVRVGFFFFSSRRRHTRWTGDWSSDVCSSDLPACTLTWHDGGNLPPRPPEMEAEKFEESGTLFIGEKGKLMCDTYGERPRLLPESSMADFKRPAETIPRVPGNSPYQDFIRACKGGPAACSNFDVAGPFTETVLLGNLALRLGKKIEWDPVAMKITNVPEANQYIRTEYRN